MRGRYSACSPAASAQALPWVRYITQGGDYQIRFDDFSGKDSSGKDSGRY